jgi:hypothetical protein
MGAAVEAFAVVHDWSLGSLPESGLTIGQALRDSMQDKRVESA